MVDEKTLLRSYREEIEELKRQLREARRVGAEGRGREHEDEKKEEERKGPGGRRSAGRDASFAAAADDDDSSSSEGESSDGDDARVLVSAIANLESLILKAGGRGARAGGSPAGAPPRGRDLDEALRRAEGGDAAGSSGIDDPEDAPRPSSSSSPAPEARDGRAQEGHRDGHLLLEELHRIQGMLGAVMKRKRRGDRAAAAATPERDAEVERLRLQLQEQEVATTMRKADSSFLQGRLNEKEGLLREVSTLLEALEKRQVDLERENKQLREDLAEAANMIEEGEAARKSTEQRLAETEAQLAEKKDVVFVEHRTS
ncbi:hypothetical protein ACHAWF_010728 [Thalassiosira exigua]